MRFKDYYETLGVARTATDAEIKAAFRKLARKHHPDMVAEGAKAGAEERFKEINEAYEVLSDPEKRKRYDTLGAGWDQQGGPAPGHGGGGGFGGWNGGESDFEFQGTGFSDFFERFFGGGQSDFYPGGGAGAAGPKKGRDVEADLLVSLEESLQGSTRELALRRPGSNSQNTFQVRIPAGVREGQRLRVAGQGNPGRGGVAAGDLYLRVRLAKHPDFRVEGSDLFYDLNVAPWDAVLGIVTKVPALGNPISVKIPPGTSAGTQLRLRGHGLPKKGGERGDLYTSIQIQVPTVISPEERSHWEALSRISHFQPEA
jgi:curved DNA-binding protein